MDHGLWWKQKLAFSLLRCIMMHSPEFAAMFNGRIEKCISRFSRRNASSEGFEGYYFLSSNWPFHSVSHYGCQFFHGTFSFISSTSSAYHMNPTGGCICWCSSLRIFSLRGLQFLNECFQCALPPPTIQWQPKRAFYLTPLKTHCPGWLFTSSDLPA